MKRPFTFRPVDSAGEGIFGAYFAKGLEPSGRASLSVHATIAKSLHLTRCRTVNESSFQ